MRVSQGDPHRVALLDANRGTRRTGNRSHALAFGREHPEFHELSWIDLFADLDDFQPDIDFVRVAVSVEVAAQRQGIVGSARDAGFRPVLGGMSRAEGKWPDQASETHQRPEQRPRSEHLSPA